MSDLALWPFALELYARPGVEPAMLTLQDDHGQCVAYLLWALWATAGSRPLDAETLAAGAGLARSWQEAAIAPLREMRRGLKQSANADQGRAHLREQVKGLELEAERLLLEMLEQMSPPPSLGASGLRPIDPAETIAAAALAWGASPPSDDLRRLAVLVA